MSWAMATESEPARVALYNDPKLRGIFYQIVLFAVVLWLGYEFVVNARDNLRAANIATGLDFLDRTAGFSINQTLIPYTESDTTRSVFRSPTTNTRPYVSDSVYGISVWLMLKPAVRSRKSRPVAMLAARRLSRALTTNS